MPKFFFLVDTDDARAERFAAGLRRAGVNAARLSCDVLRDKLRAKAAERRDVQAPTILFLGVGEGEDDGVRILKEIRSDESAVTIPVIVLADSVCEAETYYDLGCNLHVAMPADPVKLDDAMGALGAFLKTVTIPG